MSNKEATVKGHFRFKNLAAIGKQMKINLGKDDKTGEDVYIDIIHGIWKDYPAKYLHLYKKYTMHKCIDENLTDFYWSENIPKYQVIPKEETTKKYIAQRVEEGVNAAVAALREEMYESSKSSKSSGKSKGK